MEHVLQVKANGRQAQLVHNLRGLAELMGAELTIEEMIEIRTANSLLRDLVMQVEGVVVHDVTRPAEEPLQAHWLNEGSATTGLTAEGSQFFQNDHGYDGFVEEPENVRSYEPAAASDPLDLARAAGRPPAVREKRDDRGVARVDRQEGEA